MLKDKNKTTTFLDIPQNSTPSEYILQKRGEMRPYSDKGCENVLPRELYHRNTKWTSLGQREITPDGNPKL